jgi:uncharacterized protein YidB (DUF937 family)
MIAVVGQLIEKAGGMQGLISTLQQHGLGGAVQSWVGTGANEPVSGDGWARRCSSAAWVRWYRKRRAS